MSERINSFRDLRVYLEACDLDFAIHQQSKCFPRDEMFALTDQVRRSSRSVGANIAEAWAKRLYPAHFVSKLTDADAELQETRHWLGRALTYGYLTSDEHARLQIRCDGIGAMLGKMLHNPDSFTRD